MKKFFASISLFFTVLGVFYAQNTAEVLQFSAEVKEDSVYLTWTTSGAVSSLILYRSLNPFTDFSSLANAVLLSTFTENTTAFVDYPLPNTNYYYALVFEKEITTDNSIKFLPGRNTLIQPVRLVRETEEDELAERAVSLPVLNTANGVSAKRVTFSAETEQKLHELEANFAKYAGYVYSMEHTTTDIEPIFFRFTEETDAARDVSALSLKRILDAHTETESWTELEAELNDFLRPSHTPLIDARAAFYRAEALFFSGKYDRALLQFLQVEDTFKTETKPWITLTLKKLTNP